MPRYAYHIRHTRTHTRVNLRLHHISIPAVTGSGLRIPVVLQQQLRVLALTYPTLHVLVAQERNESIPLRTCMQIHTNI